MQDRTIDNALLALRKQIIRGDLDGLEQVEALLTMRGVRMPRVLPPWRENVARGHEIRGIIKRTLQDGPKTLAEVAQAISDARGEDYSRHRAAQVLYKMKLAGIVRNSDGCWSKL